MNAPLAWLMDTNVVSEMMRPRPEPQVAAFLDSIAEEGLGLASVTVREVFDGIGRLAPGRRRRGLADRFHDLLGELFEDREADRLGHMPRMPEPGDTALMCGRCSGVGDRGSDHADCHGTGMTFVMKHVPGESDADFWRRQREFAEREAEERARMQSLDEETRELSREDERRTCDE